MSEFDDLLPDEPGDFGDLVPPSVTSKSEDTARNLSIFGGRFDPIGSAEMMLTMGTGAANEALRGIAGIAGTAAGMWPGGRTPNELGNIAMEKVPDFTYEPRTQGGQAGVEMAGAGMEKATQGVKYVGSGYAGLGAMAAGADAGEATQSMQDFRQTPNALGENTFQATGSPTLAVVAQLLPEAASALVAPERAAVRRAQRPVAPDMPPSGYGGIGTPDPVRPAAPAGPVAPDPGAFERVRAALQAGDREALMAEINANPAIVAAFDELGIEWTPGTVSENAALRQVEGGLESVADTGIKQSYSNIRAQLDQKANELVSSVEGAGSRAGASTDIKMRFEELHDAYVGQERVRWDALKDKVPRDREVPAQDVADRILKEAELAGRNGNIDDGLKSMSKHERELFRLTHEKQMVEKTRTIDGEDVIVEEMEWVYTEPKYAAIDRFRQDLGDGMNGQGPFGNANSAELDRLYGQMAELQKRVAREEGYLEEWRMANQSTVAKKEFEAKMQSVLGRNLNYDAIARVDTAVNNLLQGKPNRWDELFEALPQTERPIAAAQALDKIFFPTKRNMTAKFVDSWKRLKDDPELADRLFEHLDPEVRTEFMNIGEAAFGFYRQLEDVNFSRTGQARNVVDSMQQPSFMNKVLGGTAETGLGWIPVVGNIIRSARRTSTADQAQAAAVGRLRAASDLLRDPAFRRAVTEYANGRVEVAQRILKDSKSWAAWAKEQPIPMQQKIEAAGLAALFDEETEE